MANDFGFVPDKLDQTDFGFVPDAETSSARKLLNAASSNIANAVSPIEGQQDISPDESFLAATGRMQGEGLNSALGEMSHPLRDLREATSADFKPDSSAGPEWLQRIGVAASAPLGAMSAAFSYPSSIAGAATKSLIQQAEEPEERAQMLPEELRKESNVSQAVGAGAAGVVASVLPLLNRTVHDNVFPPDRPPPEVPPSAGEGPIIDNVDYSSSERKLLPSAPKDEPVVPSVAEEVAPYTQHYDFDTDSFGVKNPEGEFIKTGFETPEEARAHADEVSLVGEEPKAAAPLVEDFGFVPDNAVATYEPPARVQEPPVSTIPPIPYVPRYMSDNRNYDEVMSSGQFEPPAVRQDAVTPKFTSKSVTPQAKYPVQNFLKQNGGVEVGSNLAGELSNIGVTPRTAPGVFKAKGSGGLTDIDNIPHSQWKFSSAPDDGNGYVDRQYVLDSIAAERAGKPVTNQDHMPPEGSIAPGSPEDFEQYARSLGVDTTGLSHERIKQEVAEAEYNVERARESEILAAEETRGNTLESKTPPDVNQPSLFDNENSGKQLAAAREGRLKPRVGQKPANEGLFSSQEKPAVGDLFTQKPSITHTVAEFSEHAAKYPQTVEGMHQAAKDFVIAKGKDTGNEHLVSVDENGSVNHHAEGTPNRVDIPDALNNELIEGNGKFYTLHHNHSPDTVVKVSGVGLSPADISILAKRGTRDIVAHTHGGKSSVASLTPEMRNALDNSKYSQVGKQDTLRNIARVAWEDSSAMVMKYVNDGVLPRDNEVAIVGHNEIFNRILDNLGVTRYSSTGHGTNGFPPEIVNDIIAKVTSTIKPQLDRLGYGLKGHIEGQLPYKSSDSVPSKGVVGGVQEGNARTEVKVPGRSGSTETGRRSSEANVGDYWTKERAEDHLREALTNAGYSRSEQENFIARAKNDTLGFSRGKTPNHILKAADALRDVVKNGTLESKIEPVTTAIKNAIGDKPESGLSKVLKEIRDTISPTMASKLAAKTALAIRKAYGLARRERSIDEATLLKVARLAARMDEASRQEFYKYVEGRSQGAQLANKELQPLADSTREVYQRMKARLEAMPENRQMNFVQDYFTHQWKNPEKAQAFVNDFIAAQGSMRNLKQRSLPTIADGLKAGLELAEPNPVRAVSRYLGSMNNYIASVNALRAITQDLGATFARTGMQPEGYEPLIGRNAERIQNAQIDPKSGKVVPSQKLQLYAPKDVARIYNRFYSKGLETTGLKTTYGLLREAVNANTLMELGLSTYHAGTITIQSLNQDLARVLKNSITGDWKGVADAAKKFATPGLHYKSGKALVEQYKHLADHGVDVEGMAKHFAEANLRLGNDPLSVVSKKGFVEAHHRGELPELIDRLKQQAKEGYGKGLLKSGAEVVQRVVSDVSAPLFNKYIPAIKMSSFADLMGDWLRQNPGASRAEIEVNQARIGNLIDSRFGEKNTENIFWSKMAKQVTGLAFRAPGWDQGLIEQIAGPGKDAFSAINDAVKGKKFDPANLDRALYMVSAVTLFAAMNSAMTWLKTGTPPSDQQMKDLIAYRTGGMRRAFGRMLPERGLLPGHGREIVGMYPIPGKGNLSGVGEEVKNKVASLPKNVWDIVTNSDWKDKPIYDPKSKQWVFRTPGVAQAAYLAQGFKPFMIDGLMGDPEHPGSNLNFMERSLGVRPAGTRITDREDLGNFLAHKK